MILLAAVLLLTLLFSRGFCGWICPFGRLQEWLGMLGKKVFKKQDNPTGVWEILAAIVALTWHLGTLVFRPYDPVLLQVRVPAGGGDRDCGEAGADQDRAKRGRLQGLQCVPAKLLCAHRVPVDEHHPRHGVQPLPGLRRALSEAKRAGAEGGRVEGPVRGLRVAAGGGAIRDDRGEPVVGALAREAGDGIQEFRNAVAEYRNSSGSRRDARRQQAADDPDDEAEPGDGGEGGDEVDPPAGLAFGLDEDAGAVDSFVVVEDFAIGLASGYELFDFEAHLQGDLAAMDGDGFGPAAGGEQGVLKPANTLRIGGVSGEDGCQEQQQG